MNLNDKKLKLTELGIDDWHDEQLLYLLNEILTSTGNKTIDRVYNFKLSLEDIYSVCNGLPAFNGEKFIIDHKSKLIEYGIDLNEHLKFDRRDEIDYDYGFDVLRCIVNFYNYDIEETQIPHKYSTSCIDGYVITDEYNPYSNYNGDV